MSRSLGRRVGVRPWLACAVALALAVALGGQAAAQDTAVVLFWGEGCPHCAVAKPFLEGLAREHGVGMRSFEIYGDEDARRLFAAAGRSYGFEPRGVPTILIGDEVFVGYAETMDDTLGGRVAACAAGGCADPMRRILATMVGAAGSRVPSVLGSTGDTLAADAAAAPATPGLGSVDLPLVGAVNLQGRSPLATTALIALVDGFNPCSLWVLSLLLAVVVNTGSRRKLLLVGLSFLGTAALVYALFIAGLVNVLGLVASLAWVRAAVAVITLAFALVNLKDYLWWRQGPSLTIPEAQKPRIYRGIRGVMASRGNAVALVGASAALGAGVTVFELPCTVGFPVVWADMVVGWKLGAAGFAWLLAVYLVIFLLDEMILFGAAVVSLRVTRLDERHGRLLKLVGGMLMLFLAATLLLRPTWMNELGSALAVVAASLAAAAAVHGLTLLLAHLRGGPAVARVTGAPSTRTTAPDAAAASRPPRGRRAR